MAPMNNNFDKLAEDFLNFNIRDYEEEEWSTEELENKIRDFLSQKGLDEAWIDEAVEVIKDHFDANS